MNVSFDVEYATTHNIDIKPEHLNYHSMRFKTHGLQVQEADVKLGNEQRSVRF